MSLREELAELRKITPNATIVNGEVDTMGIRTTCPYCGKEVLADVAYTNSYATVATVAECDCGARVNGMWEK